MLSNVWLFVTLWTVSMGFSRQEYWGGLTFPSLSIFLTQGSNPTQESNPSLQHCMHIFYHLIHQGSPKINIVVIFEREKAVIGVRYPEEATGKTDLYNKINCEIESIILSLKMETLIWWQLQTRWNWNLAFNPLQNFPNPTVSPPHPHPSLFSFPFFLLSHCGGSTIFTKASPDTKIIIPSSVGV